jgi:hypothetical protein
MTFKRSVPARMMIARDTGGSASKEFLRGTWRRSVDQIPKLVDELALARLRIIPGCGLPQALVTGVEYLHQRSNNSHAAENGPVRTWPAIPTGREFMNRLRKHTLRWTVPALLLAGQAAAQSSYDLKLPDARILKGGALVEDSV